MARSKPRTATTSQLLSSDAQMTPESSTTPPACSTYTQHARSAKISGCEGFQIPSTKKMHVIKDFPTSSLCTATLPDLYSELTITTSSLALYP